MSADALKTVAGRLLYRHLPEEYRYRDTRTEAELGDLEAYLHGFGHLMDLFQGTLAQVYADGFAEVADNGRTSQTWVLPYLAALLGTRLIAPDLDGTGDIRRAELNHAVGWSKGKGTLRVADSTADVMAGAETHVVEGWRRVAVTPRLALPPFSLPRAAGAALSALRPLGTPDLRRTARAVQDATATDPLQSFRLPARDAEGLPVTERLHWRLANRTGVPCFPNSFADLSVTTPDIRTTALRGVGPAPRRVTVFVQPPAGFFEAGLTSLALDTPALNAFADAHPTGTSRPVRIGPAEAMEAAGLPQPAGGTPDRVTLTGGLTIQPGRSVALEAMNVLGEILVRSGARLWLSDCAVARVTLEVPGDPATPSLVAVHTLLGRLSGPAGFARLEYVTVMGETQAARLQASDCIFVGPFDDPTCFDAGSCIRFSRLPRGLQASNCAFVRARSNTADRPRFVRRPLPDGAGCTLREAAFGEPGAGVLDHAAPVTIRKGSEDGMEMGAFHGRAYAARLDALERKLADQLPIGQTIDLRHDPMLAIRPPTEVAP